MNLELHRLETIVFDCGDTLLSLSPTREQVCQGVLKALGFSFGLEQIATAFRVVDFSLKQNATAMKSSGDKRAFLTRYNRALTEALGITSVAQRFDAENFAAFREQAHWRPSAGVEEALTRLGETGVPLYVLANWDANLEQVLSGAGILHFFAGVFASFTLRAQKPDPAIFARFVEATGVDPTSALYVGNEYTADVFGSRRAGFTPLLLDRQARYCAAVDCAYASSWPEATTLITSCLRKEPT